MAWQYNANSRGCFLICPGVGFVLIAILTVILNHKGLLPHQRRLCSEEPEVCVGDDWLKSQNCVFSPIIGRSVFVQKVEL